jgi:hypothetical protein
VNQARLATSSHRTTCIVHAMAVHLLGRNTRRKSVGAGKRGYSMLTLIPSAA